MTVGQVSTPHQPSLQEASSTSQRAEGCQQTKSFCINTFKGMSRLLVRKCESIPEPARHIMAGFVAAFSAPAEIANGICLLSTGKTLHEQLGLAVLADDEVQKQIPDTQKQSSLPVDQSKKALENFHLKAALLKQDASVQGLQRRLSASEDSVHYLKMENQALRNRQSEKPQAGDFEGLDDFHHEQESLRSSLEIELGKEADEKNRLFKNLLSEKERVTKGLKAKFDSDLDQKEVRLQELLALNAKLEQVNKERSAALDVKDEQVHVLEIAIQRQQSEFDENKARLSSENEKVKKSMEMLSSEKSVLQNEISALAEKNNLQNLETEQLNTRLQELQAQLSRADEQQAVMSVENEGLHDDQDAQQRNVLETQITELNERIDQQHEDVPELRLSLRSLQRKLNKANYYKGHYCEENIALNKDLKRIIEEKNELIVEKAELENRVENQDRSEACLARRIQNLEAELTKSIQDQRDVHDQLSTERESLEGLKKELQRAQDELKVSRDETAQRQIANVEADIVIEKNKNESLQKELDQLRKQFAVQAQLLDSQQIMLLDEKDQAGTWFEQELRSQLDSMAENEGGELINDKDDKIANLEFENEDVKTELKQVQERSKQVIVDLQHAEQMVSTAQGELKEQQLLSELQDAKNTLENVKGEKSRSASDTDETIAALKAELKDLNGKFEGLKIENDKKALLLEEEKKSKVDLITKQQNAQKKLVKAKEKNETLANTAKEDKAELEMLSVKLNQLQEMHVAANRMHDETMQKVSAAEADKARLNTEVSGLKAELTKVSDRLAKALCDKNQLLSSTRESKVEFETEIASLKDDLKRTTDQYNLAQCSIAYEQRVKKCAQNALSMSDTRLNREKDQIRAELEAVRREKDKLVRKADKTEFKLKEKVRTLEAKLDSARAESEQIQVRLSHETSEKLNAHNDIKRFKASSREQDNEILRLKTQIDVGGAKLFW